MTSHFTHHVFFCLNQRENGAACCMNHSAESMFNYMKSRIKTLEFSCVGNIRINRAGCLDRCAVGPVLVVYPDAIWYTFIDEDDIDEIIDLHLINGQIVERLVV